MPAYLKFGDIKGESLDETVKENADVLSDDAEALLLLLDQSTLADGFVFDYKNVSVESKGGFSMGWDNVKNVSWRGATAEGVEELADEIERLLEQSDLDVEVTTYGNDRYIKLDMKELIVTSVDVGGADEDGDLTAGVDDLLA